jgi:predicted metallopeptidase
MTKFIEAPELKELARKVIFVREEVYHVDVNDVLFLKELETMPPAAARTYNLNDHPIQVFTHKHFAIVFYESKIDYFTDEQRAILMFHELMHIPTLKNRLIDHDVKDFHEVLKLGVDWSQPNATVPNILEGL